MRRCRLVAYVLAGLVAFIFSSGFLGLCMGPNYSPCTVEFSDPVNGAVLPAGSEDVTVFGRVVAGSKKPAMLKVDGKLVDFDKSTGEFSCTVPVTAERIYSVYTFEVFDQNFIANKEKLALATGTAADPAAVDGEGKPLVVDNALGILLTDGFMDELEEIIPILLNPMIDEALASGLPMRQSLGDLLGDLVITELRIGDIAMTIDIRDGDYISASIDITAPPEGGRAVYVDGYHDPIIGGNVDIDFWTDRLQIKDVRLRLAVNDTDDIVATLDLGSADIDMNDPHVAYGIVAVPHWLTNAVINIIDDFLGDILGDLSLPVMNLRDLATETAGISVAAWPMQQDPLFSSSDTTMAIDLGLNTCPVTPVFPELCAFRSTPDDAVPLMTPAGDENLMVAINDDMINEFAFALVQTGALIDLDMSSKVADTLGALGKDLKAYVSLVTPPVADFSGAPLGIKAVGEITTDFGRFVIPNLIIEIKKPLLFGWKYSARLSVDVDAALKLKLSEDGRRIRATMDSLQSDTSITVLYDNTTNAALLPVIGHTITNEVINLVLEKLVDIKVPLIGLEGADLGISFTGTELVGAHNALVAKLLVENATVVE